MSTKITFMRLFFTGLIIAENAMIYNFVSRLVKAKCKCSDDWRREAITAMTVFNFVLTLLALMSSSLNMKPPSSYVFMYILYSLLYFVIVLSYTYKLRQDKCKCAKGLDASIIYYKRVIVVLLMMFLLTVAVMSMI